MRTVRPCPGCTRAAAVSVCRRVVTVLAAAVLVLCAASCSFLPRQPYGDGPIDEVRTEVAAIRGLAWKQDIPFNSMDREALKHLLDEELNESWEEEGAGLERAYKAFGLLPRDMDLKPWYSDFMKEQIAAFYHPEKKALFTVDEQDLVTDGTPVQSFVFAHELLHALEDQHFDFEAAEEKLKTNEDAQSAHQALVEGSATDGGLEYLVWGLGVPMSMAGPTGRTVSRLLARMDLEELEDLGTTDTDDPAVTALAEAPPLIKAHLLFPYIGGWRFAAELRSEFGWRGIDSAYRDLPESSEQIIHPERYIDRRDRPVRIQLASPPADWPIRHEGTMGMLTVRVLFASLLDEKAAAYAEGWDGDRYAVWETPDGDAIGWVSVWDRRAQARRFAQKYEELLQKSPDIAGRWAVLRRDNVVVVTQGALGGRAEAVATALLGSTLEVSPDDKPPHHPLTRLALWPLSIRPLDRVWEASLLGGMALDGRFHADGHRLRLADSLLLHSESSPDRFALWAACGWIGGLADDSLGISYVRLPFVLNWHGRAQLGEEASRARCSLALGSVYYRREGTGKRLKLLWGLLLNAGWGSAEQGGTRVRVLGIPLLRGNPTDT
jgi:hypothetical protein